MIIYDFIRSRLVTKIHIKRKLLKPQNTIVRNIQILHRPTTLSLRLEQKFYTFSHNKNFLMTHKIITFAFTIHAPAALSIFTSHPNKQLFCCSDRIKSNLPVCNLLSPAAVFLLLLNRGKYTITVKKLRIPP